MSNSNRVQQLLDLLLAKHLIDQKTHDAWQAQSLGTLAAAEKIIRNQIVIGDEQWTEVKAASANNK